MSEKVVTIDDWYRVKRSWRGGEEKDETFSPSNFRKLLQAMGPQNRTAELVKMTVERVPAR